MDAKIKKKNLKSQIYLRLCSFKYFMLNEFIVSF